MRTPLRPKDWLSDRLLGHKGDDVYLREWEPQLAVRPSLDEPMSQACTFEQMRSPVYRAWCDELGQPHLTHRKQWEWVYILRCLQLADVMRDGSIGLGVGEDTSVIAQRAAFRGAVTITDSENWNSASGLDFVWSAGASAHLGTIADGLEMIRQSVKKLRPGGTAVHTTEYNVSSDDDTVESGSTVVFRRRDIDKFLREMRARGHEAKATFGLGSLNEDRHIDEAPFSNTHIKTRFEGYVITSFGLLIQKRS